MAARMQHRFHRLLPLAGLFVLTLGLTLLGVLTRPIESLSLFWPVNAILLGLLLRQPHRATPAGWLTIYAGMLAVDLGSGNTWLPALWLNACNMGLLLTGWHLMMRRPVPQLRLETPQALLHLLIACAAGAAVAASLACLMNGARWFDGTLQTTWLAWFSEQFSTCLLILPALLTAPPFRRPGRHDFAHADVRPMLALLASLLAGLAIGGPGALAFPVPALLWCALAYRLFTLAVLTMLTGLAEIIVVAGDLVYYGVPHSSAGVGALMSARLGISMLVMGPLVVAITIALNRQLLARLEHRANHDTLTGALERSALTQQTSALMERRRQQRNSAPLALLMIDIDHFKAINDTHGHAMGDQVLREFANQLRQQLRQGELFGRLGGEEFVVVLPGATRTEALHIAERLRSLVERLEFPVTEGNSLHITVSIGVALTDQEDDIPLEQMLSRADVALYRAKAQGRNRVMAAEENL